MPTESFFNFFSPPKPPAEEAEDDEEEDDAASDIEERLELDYQLGEDIKEKLIPRAVDWFTGEALAYEEIDEDDLDAGDFDDDDDEDDDDLSEDHDDEEETDDEVSSFADPDYGDESNVPTRTSLASRSRRRPSASRAKERSGSTHRYSLLNRSAMCFGGHGQSGARFWVLLTRAP